jgi:hypothetical protein
MAQIQTKECFNSALIVFSLSLNQNIYGIFNGLKQKLWVAYLFFFLEAGDKPRRAGLSPLLTFGSPYQ